jgi:hypothetical protein
MTGSSRLRALAVSCILAGVLAGAVVVFTGVHAWATAHRTEARCLRPRTVANHQPGMAAQAPVPGSWRARTLGIAGCGALREVHDRMRHHQR